jgi:DNA (cytosine-5)-methyltransferase 1
VRIGSAFSGVGGLELGVQAVLGGTVAWHAEPDKDCRRVLEARFPGVPNLGDVTKVDWARVPRVDVLCAGFPCQDVSLAGRGAGLAHGSRTGLWRHVAEAIDVLRPPLVLLENVRGLLSGRADRGADSELGSCGWCLEEDGPPALRALGAVLGDLASRGYDAEWTSLRASDVGAPHERWRVFIAAAPADAAGGDAAVLAARDGGEPAVVGAVAGAGPGVGARDPAAGVPVLGGAAWSGVAAAADTGGIGRLRWQGERGTGRDEAVGGEAGGHPGVAAGAPAADADRVGRDGRDGQGGPGGRPEPADADRRAVVWGELWPAIQRWEQLTRPAPEAVLPSRGVEGVRLSARFSEWLMGLPAGWVDVPGVSERAQLRMLGNAVVPAQAAAAVAGLLSAAMPARLVA